MATEEKKRQAKDGLYYLLLPMLGLTVFYMLVLILGWLHLI